ncbi:reverse transcriptase-like protein [Granulicatella sp. zg-ZJ]|uniref:ribonuclease HI family protein n=1 Tax=Granulicatella sp. zg-ZJ TaxID=2678504 RepID=UPI0013D4AB78|nr:ribonuclease HI family protein [Granulicatella sp. zg-ZJ]NEW62112.1 reverse transcriptase-like protein [Granulicatella sp. zg-ZJ]
MIKMYIDAACSIPPQRIGIGIVIYKDKQQQQLSIPLNKALNNHEAEYEAIYQGLCYLIEKELHHDIVLIYSDSKVVVTALNRKSAKNSWQQPYLDKILPLLNQLHHYYIEWFSDKENKMPDILAKRALTLRE